MTSTLTAISEMRGDNGAAKERRADARLAPGGPKRPRPRAARAAQKPQARDEARWQLILDLLDPGKRCGAWSPVTFAGRPVVCTRAPHDARDEHSDDETGWRWYGEER